MTKVGSIVWVRPGLGDHEEPATVLQVKCHFEYHEDDKSDDNADGKNEDGILIRYNVSFAEAIVHPSKIRALIMDDDEEEEEAGDGKSKKVTRRRSSRRIRTSTSTAAASSAIDIVDTLGTVGSKSKSSKAKTKKQANGIRKNVVTKERMTTSTARDDMNTPSIQEEKKMEINDDDDGGSDLDMNEKDIQEDNNKNSDNDDDDDDDDFVLSTYQSEKKKSTKKRKRQNHTSTSTDTRRSDSSKKKKALSSPYFEDNNVNNDKDDDDSVVSKTTRSNNATKRKKSSTKTTTNKATTTKTSTSTTTSKSKPKAGQPDGHGNLTCNKDSIYIIEYAKTGRSTCKRCDQRIKKDELRVGHRPLFRGKPGFRIYKHLHCIVFSSEICTGVDVDGYEDLNNEDIERLEKRIKESQIEIKEENEELHPDELVQKGFEGEIREKPNGLKANLLPFQKEGVSWMYCQECNVPDIRGGILADEMGMGKTLQTITILLDHRPKLQHSLPGTKHPPSYTDEMKKNLDGEEKLWNDTLKEWQHEMKMNDVPPSILPKGRKNDGGAGGGARAGTLVICPVIALTQWKSEIEKFCDENALTICIYHGPERTKLIKREMLRKFDVVLTTYQVIEQDFRKMISPNKVKCPNCGKKFKIDKLRVHLKYFCGEGAQRTEAQARTRRNSERTDLDRDRRNSNRGGSGDSGKSGNGKKKVMKSKVATKKTKPMMTKKKLFKVKGDEDYDSESDLSETDDNVVGMTKRSPRTAAVKAKKRVVTYVRTERKGKKSVDSSDGDDGSDEDYDDNEDESPDDESPDDDESSEDEAIKRAKSRQAKALERAKGKGKVAKKEFPKGKKFPKHNQKKKMQKKVIKKKSSKKVTIAKKGRKDPGEDSDSEYDSNSDDDIGVDMDALIAEAMAGAQMSVLHSFCWWRVVLDEAHFIKSRSSQTSASAFALTGVHRWCLSGTPLQNRVGEFYSLVRFLRLDPMAHYMCRANNCNCKQVHYRMMNGRCKDCGHSSIQHYSYFNRQILNPIQRDGYTNDGRRAMFTLKNEVLDKCLLRRTKETRAEDMNLPPRIVTIKSIKLHPIEEDFYNAVFTKTSSSFNDYVAEGTLLNNYAHIFDLLMRMRQSVCHPYLVVHSKRDMAARRNSTARQVHNGSTDCMLCGESITEQVVSTCCQTAFCKSCVIDYMETSAGVNENGTGHTPCPSCRNPFTIDLTQVQNIDEDTTIKGDEKISKVGLPSLLDLPHVTTGSILRRIDLTKFATSSKIEALTMELVNMRKTSPGSKAIVFSQFVNMLDLIRWRLHSDPCLAEMGLGVRALQGSMDVKARDAALKDFREDHNVRVLLMSLKAGGVALNLTVANYIYLMDPWWNPAAEMQAIDRTHRLGQFRPIRAVRFIAANTVEERILQLQEKKRLVFDGTVGRDAGSLKMLTVNDMKSLFG